VRRACAQAPLTVKTEVLDHFYRIAQEAVQNALKHAAADAIDIELWTDDSEVRLSILDDGRGLPPEMAAHEGLGMRTMHFRASAIGGTLVIETRNGGGTAVRCEAPQGSAMAALDSYNDPCGRAARNRVCAQRREPHGFAYRMVSL